MIFTKDVLFLMILEEEFCKTTIADGVNESTQSAPAIPLPAERKTVFSSVTVTAMKTVLPLAGSGIIAVAIVAPSLIAIVGWVDSLTRSSAIVALRLLSSLNVLWCTSMVND